MAWLDAFRWHPDSVFALQQETLKRGDGLVFDSGAPDGDEEGGAIYSINPSKQRSAQSDSCVDLKFGPGQLDFRRVKVPHHPTNSIKRAVCAGDVKIQACRPRRMDELLGDAKLPG